MARHSPAATAYVMVAVPAGTRRRRASSSGAAGRCWSPRCGRSGHPGADRRAGFGRPIIVKIGWPHREMYGEPAALRWWGGHGAVRLFAHDPQRHALLLERCEPGDQLATSAGPAEDALGAGCAVLRQLWELPPPVSGAFEDLAAVTEEWAGLVDERMARIKPGYDAGLVAEGTRLLRELPSSAARRVLLHGDFNPGNVLSCGGGRWAAIDPNP
jgi:streptomycin 6-kinase